MICGVSVASEVEHIRLKVSGAKVDCAHVPVCAVIELPERLANVPVEEIRAVLWELPPGPGPHELFRSISYPGQLVLVGDKKAELWWILPEAKANRTSTWEADLYDRRLQARAIRWKNFSWKDKKGEYLDLLFDGRKVTRYMYAYDTSSKQRILETYKTFHHVFDARGQNLLTNGPDGLHPYLTNKILYPHHRGIFIGWNGLEFGGKRYDFWHMGEQGRVQKHQKFLEQTAGPVLAKSKSLVHWNNKDGQTIIAERRETTVFRQSDPTVLLLEFRTELKAVSGDVFLDGDPEHAGLQYRPHDGVAKGGKEAGATYLFHKEGINPKKDKDIPWVGMSYGLNDRRYSVEHMNHPDNPSPTVYSAYRDYGRFGAFFKKEIGAGETLTLRYRMWVVEGEMPERQELASKYSAFVDGPKVDPVRRESDSGSVGASVWTSNGVEVVSSELAIKTPVAKKPSHIIGINYAAWYPKGWWDRPGAKGYGHVWRVREGVSAKDRPGGANANANPVKPLFSPHTEYGGWNKKAVRWDIKQARRAGITAFAMTVSHGFMKEYHLMGDAILAENFGFLVMADARLTDDELIRYLQRWTKKPSYLRIDGRPVVWVYGGSNLANRGRVEREVGEPIYAIGSHRTFRLDVLSDYSWITDIFDPSGRAEPKYRDLSRRKVSFAPIMTAMFTAGGQSTSWDANRWRSYWDIVHRYPQNNPHADIYFVIWNEIFETSLIVPTHEYGYEPLDVTREMLKKCGLVKGR